MFLVELGGLEFVFHSVLDGEDLEVVGVVLYSVGTGKASLTGDGFVGYHVVGALLQLV